VAAATFFNLFPILLYVLPPLVCTTIIARHMNRSWFLRALPWILLMVFSGIAALVLSLRTEQLPAATASVLLQSIGMGGSAALVIALIVLASVGAKRENPTVVESL